MARVLDDATVNPVQLLRWYAEVVRWYSQHGEHGQARQTTGAARRTLPGWPWPVAVRTLGPLTLSLCGDIVAPSGKSLQRPLALLKSLIAAGPGGKSQQALLS